MFCKKCGKKLEEEAKFCDECGTRVEVINEPVKPVGSGRYHEKTVKINGYQRGVIGASLLMMLSTVLPYWKIIYDPVVYITGFDTISMLKAGDQIGDGIILIILAVIIILFTCFGKKIPVLICSILSLVVYIFDFLGMLLMLSDWQSKMLVYVKVDDLLVKGTGFYLLPVSVILLMITTIIYMAKKRKY